MAGMPAEEYLARFGGHDLPEQFCELDHLLLMVRGHATFTSLVLPCCSWGSEAFRSLALPLGDYFAGLHN